MDNDSPNSVFPTPPTSPAADNTASRSQRFTAACIDVVIMMVFIFPMAHNMGLMELVEKQGSVPPNLALKLVLFQLMMFFILHGFLLHQYGQTLGKRVLGIAIVTLDNQKPAFLPLILHRYVSQWAMGMVPVIGILLRLGDVLAIFRDDRRCWHDLIAKTKVIDIKVPVGASQPSSIII